MRIQICFYSYGSHMQNLHSSFVNWYSITNRHRNALRKSHQFKQNASTAEFLEILVISDDPGNRSFHVCSQLYIKISYILKAMFLYFFLWPTSRDVNVNPILPVKSTLSFLKRKVMRLFHMFFLLECFWVKKVMEAYLFLSYKSLTMFTVLHA